MHDTIRNTQYAIQPTTVRVQIRSIGKRFVRATLGGVATLRTGWTTPTLVVNRQGDHKGRPYSGLFSTPILNAYQPARYAMQPLKPVSLDEVRAARERIAGAAIRTPLVRLN